MVLADAVAVNRVQMLLLVNFLVEEFGILVAVEVRRDVRLATTDDWLVDLAAFQINKCAFRAMLE